MHAIIAEYDLKPMPWRSRSQI